MEKPFVYLTAVIDVASRRVLAHKTPTTLEVCRAVEIIEQAFAKFCTPEIVNADQGGQFTASEFATTVLKRACTSSMDGRGAWWRDNVFFERLWRCVKYERVCLRAYDTARQARSDIAKFLGGCNTKRQCTSIPNQTPDQAYWKRLSPMPTAA